LQLLAGEKAQINHEQNQASQNIYDKSTTLAVSPAQRNEANRKPNAKKPQGGGRFFYSPVQPSA
jgi:hypothetical protein